VIGKIDNNKCKVCGKRRSFLSSNPGICLSCRENINKQLKPLIPNVDEIEKRILGNDLIERMEERIKKAF
jgi:hypothetical protein